MDRRGILFQVDVVLDSVHALVVVDVESLTQFQDVRVVVTIDHTKGVSVVQHKGAEVSCHHPRVEPFYWLVNGEVILDSREQ